MEVSEKRYYKLNEIFMTLIGQWPYQTRRESWFFLTVLLLLCGSQIAPEVMAVVQYRNDPEVIFESFPTFIFILGTFTKLITCKINSKQMLMLLIRIGKDWKVWAHDREVSVLHEYAETGRKMTILYAVSISSTGIVFITQPALQKIIDVLLYNGTKPGEFPFPVYYPIFDQQKYYFYIVGYMYLCTGVLISINVAGDTMFMVYVQHVCGIFAALGHNLERIGENVISVDGRDMDFEYLATFIDRHKDAIEFAKLIEATYSGCFFIVVGCNMLIMSVTGLQIVTRTNEPQDIIRFVPFVGAQIIHLYIDSYVSQMLMDHSTSIRDYIQSGKWYNISLKSQKLVNMMTMRSNEPCVLTAGKICIMSVETFTTVMKTSMSYFTLLRSVQ